MKIALVILHADPARGGAERYTLDLFAALRERGHDPFLLASSFGHGDPPNWGVRLESRATTRAGRYARFLDSLDRHLENHAYDIVHAMLPVRRCDVYHPHAGIAAESMPSTIRSLLNPRRRMFAATERKLLTQPNPPTVLCLSQYVRGLVQRHYDLPSHKLPVLINAVDLNNFDPAARPQAGAALRKQLGIDPGKVVALIIAQDFQRKGLREAILATARIDDPRLVLLVVGKEDPGRYRQLAIRENVSDRVIFAGTTDDPYSFYRAADFFVLPTRHDPCSLVVLEALAMGLPVISTVFNGACEIMTHGTHGFVLNDPADIPALVLAMRRMLQDNGMALACRKLRPLLAYERHLDRLLQIYQDAARTDPKLAARASGV